MVRLLVIVTCSWYVPGHSSMVGTTSGWAVSRLSAAVTADCTVLYRAVAQLLSAAVAVPVVATQSTGRVDALAAPADASSAAEVTATTPRPLTTRTADRAAGPRDPRRNTVLRMGTFRLRCVDA